MNWRCAGTEGERRDPGDPRRDRDGRGSEHPLRHDDMQRCRAVGRRQQRRECRTLGTESPVRVVLIREVRARMHVRVRVRLGTELRHEHRDHGDQRNSQAERQSPDAQVGYSQNGPGY